MKHDTICLKSVPWLEGYPWKSFAVSVLFILIAPFTGKTLVFVPFAIQLLRMVFYDEHVFMADMAFLSCFASLFKLPSGISVVGILMVFGDAWLIVRHIRNRFKLPLLFLVPLLLFLAFQTGGRYTDYMFIAAGLIYLYVTLEKLDVRDSGRIALLFVVGILLASVYGFIFRNSPAIIQYVSSSSLVSSGAEVYRFKGLSLDSNYYSVYLIMAIIFSLQLYILKQVRLINFVILTVLLATFGILTYSRSFFLMMLVLCLFFVYLLFENKKYGVAFLLCVAILALVVLTISGKISLFNTVLERFFGSKNMSQMTSGRTDLWTRYWEYITSNPLVLFFGSNLNAPLQGAEGTHNVFLEILYYVGSVSLVLMAFYVVSLIRMVKHARISAYSFKYKFLAVLPLLAFFALYFTLQGMFSSVFYVQISVTLSTLLLPDLAGVKPSESREADFKRKSEGVMLTNKNYIEDKY